MTDGAEATDKATIGRIAWLGSEWRPGWCTALAWGKAKRS